MDSISSSPHAARHHNLEHAHDLSTEPTLPALKTSASMPSGLETASSVAGSKRPAPSLLPPFEPLSSSPGLPRPAKRQNTASGPTRAHLKYPTPVPTSSTGILSSSPPRRGAANAVSASLVNGNAPAGASGTERAPLSAVPAVELSENGETLIMGRSSNSSHFQLSANRLVSRVHVKARFVAATTPLEPHRIEILCNGWNGLKLHCQGRTWELFKGDSFTSETEGSEIMVDVQDARVLIQWPGSHSGAKATSGGHEGLSDSSWDDSPRSQSRGGNAGMSNALLLQSSPLRRTTRIASPESPTPAGNSLSSSRRLQALLPDARDSTASSIEIYEDEPELPEPKLEIDPNVSMRTEATASFTSDLGHDDEDSDEHHDPDEENDPIVHSFGPFGADISGRLASITTKSPKVVIKNKASSAIAKRIPKPLTSGAAFGQDLFAPRQIPSVPSSPKKMATAPRAESPLSSPPPLNSSPEPQPSPEPPKRLIDVNPAVANHVINQLAYSRLSSTPLSTIMQHLPAEDRGELTKEALRESIEATPCIGIIERQGKDAAGKALESEYYYMPEQDDDEQRRAAVVDGLRKPSLRACRKQHKQYYWKRPRTP